MGSGKEEQKKKAGVVCVDWGNFEGYMMVGRPRLLEADFILFFSFFFFSFVLHLLVFPGSDYSEPDLPLQEETGKSA